MPVMITDNMFLIFEHNKFLCVFFEGMKYPIFVKLEILKTHSDFCKVIKIGIFRCKFLNTFLTLESAEFNVGDKEISKAIICQPQNMNIRFLTNIN